jgi:hypothetical protein
MDLGYRTSQLQEKIDSMRNYYKFGFEAKLVGIYRDCYLFQESHQEQYKEGALCALNRLQEVYSKIPLENLANNQDFAPLFVVRDLLALFSNAVSDFFKDASPSKYKVVNYFKKAIGCSGELYRNKLEGYIEELRSIKGFEKYQVPVDNILDNDYQYGL